MHRRFLEFDRLEVLDATMSGRENHNASLGRRRWRTDGLQLPANPCFGRYICHANGKMSPSGITRTNAVNFFHVAGLKRSSGFNPFEESSRIFDWQWSTILILSSRHETPQIHEAVDRGIHREKVRVNNWHGNFSDVRASTSAEKCGLRVPEILFGKVRWRSTIGLMRIARRYALPIEAGEYAFVS